MKGKGKLLGEQRRALSRMIKGNRTLSGEACLVIARVLPMDLEIVKRRIMYVVKRNGYVE